MKVVNLIVTELAVIEVTDRGLVLKEIASDTTVEQVRAATGADAHRRESTAHSEVDGNPADHTASVPAERDSASADRRRP